jgi:hypothetical protein
VVLTDYASRVGQIRAICHLASSPLDVSVP